MTDLQNKNWFKTYKCLFEELDANFEAACFASYIFDAYKILNEIKIIDGIQYRRLSDTFINKKFDMPSQKIRKYLNMMQDHGLIQISHATSSKRSYRYIRILIYIEDYD